MFHVRSVSDPPSPTSAPAHWDSRPVTPLAPQPDNADVYAKRPLPPLPPVSNGAVPPPLNISKRKSKPSALPVGPGLGSASTEAPHMDFDAGPHARIAASPRLSPKTPARNSNLPPRMLNPPSPVHSLKHRQSKKVLQLMGYDVDVSNVMGTASQEPEKETVTRSSRSFEDPFAPKSANLLQPPEEGLVPVLEDDDGMASLSSKKSSWGPGSPHSASAFPLGPKSSVRRRRSARIFEQDGLGQFTAQDDAYMSPAVDPEEQEEYLSDEEDMTAGEYHKFAAELAASSVRKMSVEEPAQEPKGRRSSIMSFRHGSQFGRLRRRPTTADPNTRRTGSSSSAEDPAQAPPAAPEAEPQEPAEPKSMFEESSDSDSDRPNSRSRWRRDRFSHRSEERGRDSHDETSLKRGLVKSRLLGVGRRRQQAE